MEEKSKKQKFQDACDQLDDLFRDFFEEGEEPFRGMSKRLGDLYQEGMGLLDTESEYEAKQATQSNKEQEGEVRLVKDKHSITDIYSFESSDVDGRICLNAMLERGKKTDHISLELHFCPKPSESLPFVRRLRRLINEFKA